MAPKMGFGKQVIKIIKKGQAKKTFWGIFLFNGFFLMVTHSNVPFLQVPFQRSCKKWKKGTFSFFPDFYDILTFDVVNALLRSFSKIILKYRKFKKNTEK